LILVLAISGSLRARSSNTEVLRAAAALAAGAAQISFYDGLAGLPHFNPDDDVEGAVLPDAVIALREKIESADALLICSPEYAHGVPGVLKNALDWLVSGPEMVNKPVGLLNASSRSTHAQASLAETLRTMSVAMVDGASVDVPLDGRRLDAPAIAASPEFAAPIRGAIAALVAAVSTARLQNEGQPN